MRMSACTSRRASSRASTSTCNVGPSAWRVAGASSRNSAVSRRVTNRRIGMMGMLRGKRWVLPIRMQKPSESKTVKNLRCGYSHPKVAATGFILSYRAERLPAHYRLGSRHRRRRGYIVPEQERRRVACSLVNDRTVDVGAIGLACQLALGAEVRPDASAPRLATLAPKMLLSRELIRYPRQRGVLAVEVNTTHVSIDTVWTQRSKLLMRDG